MTNSKYSDIVQSFFDGTCYNASEFFGAHFTDNGVIFRVWAPNAVSVSVVGDFNIWDVKANIMCSINYGIWELEIPNLHKFDTYKYAIYTYDDQILWKFDPYGVFSELRPGNATKIYEIDGYTWGDKRWISHRKRYKIYNRPVNIYEMHFGSWKLKSDGSYYSYIEMADELIPYLKKMGYTHVEFMPLTEYPYDGSWGYQCTGYFAATSRYGTPHDLMHLIDKLHTSNIGVIMDWVPAHFPKDPHGLVEFDGTRLYECSDPLMAEHPSWGTRIFDFGKGEVRSFLISSALFWLKEFHIDGLRVDAVASMLYLDYDRDSQDWHPNKYGGRENLDAVEFIKFLNKACFSYDDSIMMIAEESTAWANVTAPTDMGGLGFNLKWNMGWMNDTLQYLKTDPLYRTNNHHKMTFALMYAYSENFVLPISHDEVVHLKGSLVGKAPGSREQKYANVRTYSAFMMAHPGKKLLFMGSELAQESEWNYQSELPWNDLQYHDHLEMQKFFSDLNVYYREHKPLWQLDFDSKGFQWVCADEANRNIYSFIRSDKSGKEVMVIFNFSGIMQNNFRIGVTGGKNYIIDFSSDEECYGGSGLLKSGDTFTVEEIPQFGHDISIVLNIPPLTSVFLRKIRTNSPKLTKNINYTPADK